MATILIIDDDEKLNQLLKGLLSDFGFSVLAPTHPGKGLKKLRQKSPDLVILSK
jgi:DNA-binding response OmpR family regulator